MSKVELFYIVFNNEVLKEIPFTNTSVGLPPERIIAYAIKFGLAHSKNLEDWLPKSPATTIGIGKKTLVEKLNQAHLSQADIVAYDLVSAGWTGRNSLTTFMENNGYALSEFSQHYKGIGQGIFIPEELNNSCLTFFQ